MATSVPAPIAMPTSAWAGSKEQIQSPSKIVSFGYASAHPVYRSLCDRLIVYSGRQATLLALIDWRGSKILEEHEKKRSLSHSYCLLPSMSI
jgi:hypothetical protein